MSLTLYSDPESPFVWTLSSTGNYSPNDTTFVESGCYDLTNDKRHVVELDIYTNSNEKLDGACLEYSIDEVTWNIIDDPIHAAAWNWYPDTVSALGTNGWSGTESQWKTARALMPLAAENDTSVKFRVKWAAGNRQSTTQFGFAFNNFKVYAAPPDIGVSSITIPRDTCLNENPSSIHVYVTNYGSNDLKTTSPVIVGVDLESEQPVFDTVTLASNLEPGDSVLLEVEAGFAIETAGTYTVKAYTMNDLDPGFYGTSNDTASKEFTLWPLPDPMLIDTIQSREPDTVTIKAHYDPTWTYTWLYDNSSSHEFDVPEDGVYTLKVVEPVHGCYNYDSTYVELLFNDVGVDSIITPISDCEHNGTEPVILRVKNFGTDSLIATDKIRLVVKVDGIERL
ncbi:MAG: hypothetical protein MI892_03975, partial [Desulfobacterales bacterium]|nr:hypothetical protein [Desulfobacterales bacterium]